MFIATMFMATILPLLRMQKTHPRRSLRVRIFVLVPMQSLAQQQSHLMRDTGKIVPLANCFFYITKLRFVRVIIIKS